jgi:rhodanese-related sulfurtransferase
MAVREAYERQVAGEAVLVDVRSAGAYGQSHVAGAISVPEGELLDRLDDLPRDVDLVLYCV